jgi:hypothetical protein
MYTQELQSYLNKILKSNKPYKIRVDSDDKYIIFNIMVDIKENDIMIVKLDRNTKNKGTFCFKNGCPGGEYPMTNNNVRNLLEFLTKRKFFGRSFMK